MPPQQTERKDRASEVKSLAGELENAKEDKASTSAELYAVRSCIVKLKLECESKAMKASSRRRRTATLTGASSRTFSTPSRPRPTSMAGSDLFGKVRGFVEDMAAKLLEEAQKEANHEAPCQEEMRQQSEQGGEDGEVGQVREPLEKGMAGAFLQTSSAPRLPQLTVSMNNIRDSDRDTLSAFLSGGEGDDAGYAPASGEIVAS